jgi:hypothetical protein
VGCRFGRPGHGGTFQEGLGQPRIVARRYSAPSLPAAQGAGIDAEKPGERGLGEAPFPPEGEQALAKGCSSGPRHVAEEPHDARQEAQGRRRAVQFPVCDGAFVDAEPVSKSRAGWRWCQQTAA